MKGMLRTAGTFAAMPRGRLKVALMGLLLAAFFVPAMAGGTSQDVIFQDGFEGMGGANKPLNDTGITWSGGYPSGNSSNCNPAHPAGQDCHYGRDAAAMAGTLQKVGAGHAGFDYTKIANDGDKLPDFAQQGSGPDGWACTLDNVTGLIWEVKTTDGGLRGSDWTYSWYDPSQPGGNPGTANGGTCYQSGRCDTAKFVVDVNTQGLCGHSDWRMPTVQELTSIVDYGYTSPAIDTKYFPNTPSSPFWSGSPYAYNSDYAWLVNFYYGFVNYYFRNYPSRVRLVRGGQ